MHASDSDHPTAPSGYRPALDGIRAVAVLSVFAYHLGIRSMRGGYLGVDFFFVLSGYLITGLIVAEFLQAGRISVPRFWARRARRLLPALLLTVMVVAIGVRTLRPFTEWPTRQMDLIWTVLYGANWHQVATSQDYFAQWVSASPLRHMWSLAIEEQFYLLWPLLMSLFLTPRLRRWLIPAVAVGAISSALAMWAAYDPGNPTRAYVGTDTRAQQLLIGALLAATMYLAPGRTSAAAKAAPWVGWLAALVVAVAFATLADSSRIYYLGGAFGLSIAMAAVIWSVEVQRTGRLARLLSVRPLAWVGQLSYGLYLWHWPAILFTPTLLLLVLGAPGMAIAESGGIALDLIRIGLSLFCTVASYYALERPIRHGLVAAYLTPRRLALAGPVAAAVALQVVWLALTVPVELEAQVTHDEAICLEASCVVVNSGPSRPVVALMGDSVALSLHSAFALMARNHGWTFVSAAHNRCTVLQHWIHLPSWDTCYASVPETWAAVMSYRPRVIVVSDNWLKVDSYDDAGQLLQGGSEPHVADIERRMDALATELTSTGALLVLMHLTPESQNVSCLDAPVATDQCRAPSSNSIVTAYNTMLDRVASRHHNRARAIDLADVVCPGNVCSAKVDGIILRFDTLHFSTEGARWLAPHLERKLVNVGVKLDL